MIPQEVINEILQKADIVQIISSYINVIKKGNSFVAICPFHNDTNPSMQISPTKQIFKCFSCGTGGNVFGFVQEYEKISFEDAVRKVASLINYSSPLLEKKERVKDDKTKLHLKALLDASNFYHYILSTSSGEKGKEYFMNRNISQEMIDYFSLGFAPENGSLTIKQLRNKQNEVSTLEQVGILIHEKGEFTDRFKNRVIFTLFNEFSEVIGFSARRILDNGESKYVNSPSTSLFNKSYVLYNYQNAKNEAKKEGYCYIVEGFMDVFSLYKANIKSAVAIMGTAFTKYHAQMLKRLNVEIRICLDGDDAGQNAILKMLPLLDNENISYTIVDYQGDNRDPDEILNQEGEKALFERVNKLIKKNDFVVKYLTKKYDLSSIDGKKAFISHLRETISFVDDVEKDVFIKEVSALTSISASSLEKVFKKKEEVNIEFNINKIDNKKRKGASKVQRQIIHYLINNDEAYKIVKNSDIVPFIDELYLKLYVFIEEVRSNKDEINVNDIVLFIQSINEKKEYIDELVSIETNKFYPNFDEEIINECIDSVKNLFIKKENDDLFNQEIYTLDEIARAKLLDQRKGVKKYGKKENN